MNQSNKGFNSFVHLFIITDCPSHHAPGRLMQSQHQLNIIYIIESSGSSGINAEPRVRECAIMK